MGFKSVDKWVVNETMEWFLQKSYRSSLENISCPNQFSWSSCSYEIRSSKYCADHGKDVFLSCNCHGISSCPKGQYYRDHCLCFQCPSNTFKDTVDLQTSCSTCPDSSTSDPGSDHCSCQAGTFWKEGRCNSCSSGSVSQKGALKCVECPAGSTAINNSTSCSCSPGKGWEWECTPRDAHIRRSHSEGGYCRMCLPGYYTNTHVTSCELCPRYASSGVGSEYCICPGGTFWNKTTCLTCTQGSVSQEGALQCQVCPLESAADTNYSFTNYSFTNNSFCNCPKGKIWSWDLYGIGSCESIDTLGKIKVSVIFVIVLLLLVIFVLVSMMILRYRKQKKERNLEKSVHNRAESDSVLQLVTYDFS